MDSAYQRVQTRPATDDQPHSSLNQHLDIPPNARHQQPNQRVSHNVDRNRPTRGPAKESHVSKRKILQVLCLLAVAIALAVGHHFYYAYLNHQVTGSESRQQWSIRIGTAFSTLAIIIFKVVVAFACVQILWVAVRKRASRIYDVDALFALGTSDFTALFVRGIWTTGLLALPIGIVIIILPAATVFPPATLTVRLQQYPSESLLDTRALNWSSWAWNCGWNNLDCVSQPVLKIATQVSQGGQVLDLYEPAPNSSYRLNFEGPSISCQAPNITQRAVFEYYEVMSALEGNVTTLSLINTTYFNDVIMNAEYPNPITRYWSAFMAPDLEDWILTMQSFNNWLPELGAEYWDDSMPRSDVKEFGTSQLWVQIFDQNFVCTLMNAEFDITVLYNRGTQTVTYNNVRHNSLFWSISPADVSAALRDSAYENVFTAFASQLNGNISLNSDPHVTEYTSNVLSTHLVACPELNWTSVLQKMNQDYPFSIFRNYSDDGSYSQSLIDSFPSNLADCRNQSLALAMEDLMNNITVSMFTSQYLTVNSSSTVTIMNNHIVYVYHAFNLIVTYGVVVAVSVLALLAGLVAAHTNGVIRIDSFSTTVATTRNPALDALFARESLGAYPISNKILDQRLIFDHLSPHSDSDGNDPDHENEHDQHAAFILEDEAKRLV